MAKIIVKKDYFSVKDTLECGQIFRFHEFGLGYKVYSEDKCAYCYNQGEFAIIECEDLDKDYFYNFFDLDRNYESIVNSALNSGVDILIQAATIGKGIRILNQNPEEALFSFVISQNNNIPRIKSSIEKLCVSLGDKKDEGENLYYAFPTAEQFSMASEEVLKSAGLGYRVSYVKSVAEQIMSGYNVKRLAVNSTCELKSKLIALKGVGEKVADCVTLFGFHRSDSFPVDTWIEKVYREDFNGTLTDRNKITSYFLNKFGEYAGYFQQYLFYFKRSFTNTSKKQQK